MDELRLFKEVYRSYSDNNLLRLLFENGEAYLYVWINRNFELESFQFILKEKTVFSFKQPDRINISEIGQEPFNRVLGKPSSAPDKKMLLDKIIEISNQDFPDLIRKVKVLSSSQELKSFKLTDSEIVFFRSLPQTHEKGSRMSMKSILRLFFTSAILLVFVFCQKKGQNVDNAKTEDGKTIITLYHKNPEQIPVAFGLRIGNSFSSLIDSLGHPDSTAVISSIEEIFFYKGKKITAELTRDHIVRLLFGESALCIYETTEGIRVGSSAGSVIDHYGTPEKTTHNDSTFEYATKNITFNLTGGISQVVTEIIIP
jgi:hypothetical protein